MRWRPTLAALGVLALVGVLATAMSSADSPTVGASLDEAPAATGMAPSPPDPTPRPAVAPAAARDTGDGSERVAPPAGVPDRAAPPAAEPGGDPLAAAARYPGYPDDGGASASVVPADGPAPPAAGPYVIPRFCPDVLDSSYSQALLDEDCQWPVLEDEQHEELAEEELELMGAVPFVAGHVAEPLGRPARAIRRGPPGEDGAPRFYLTFDDGPNPRWTPPTLDLLDRYGARATFFPAGVAAQVNFGLIEEIVARGHTIGSHLWSHERAALASEELFRRELRASAELYGELGTNCLRPPFGVVNDDILEWAGDEGFEVVLWGEPDPRDWEFPGTEELIRKMLNMQNGSILILHEHTGAQTLAALEAVLETLDARGWRFDEPICPLRF